MWRMRRTARAGAEQVWPGVIAKVVGDSVFTLRQEEMLVPVPVPVEVKWLESRPAASHSTALLALHYAALQSSRSNLAQPQ